VKITEKQIAQLTASKTRVQIYDEVPGFGLRYEPKTDTRPSRKSFFWTRRLNGVVYFKALGEWPGVPVAQARVAAEELNGVAAKWKQSEYAGANPFREEKQAERTTAPTFDELLESYIANVLMSNDPQIGALNKERAAYEIKILVKNHLSKLKNMPIDQITANHILAAKNAATGVYSQNSIVELVRRLYTWASGSRDGKLNFWKVDNPARDISLNARKPRARFLQPEELIVFNEQLEKETHVDLKDFLTLALASGVRKSNIFAARWDDVKWERGIWTIPVSKNGDAYDVGLTAKALEVLRRRYKEKTDSEFIFPSRSKTGHVVDLKKEWHKFRTRCGLADVRVHDLRRTKGSYMAISGESLQKIAGTLGHKSLGSTEIYSRLNQESVREASLAGDAAMERMMQAARKRIKLAAPKQKRLPEAVNRA
jgi:integrase